MGRWLIAITERELAATIDGRAVYRAAALEALRIPKEYTGNVLVSWLWRSAKDVCVVCVSL